MAGAFDLIAGELADADAQWSLGTFGAIAEFSRDADEPAEIQHGEMSCAVVTPRGGIRLARASGPAAGRIRDDQPRRPGASASRSACPRRRAR